MTDEQIHALWVAHCKPGTSWINEFARAIEAEVRATPTPLADAAAIAEREAGVLTIRVEKDRFDRLMDALDRAESKGYLPDAMAEEWTAFEWEVVPARASDAAAGEPESEHAVRIAMIRWHLIRLVEAWRTGKELNDRARSAFDWMRANNVGKDVLDAIGKGAVKLSAPSTKATDAIAPTEGARMPQSVSTHAKSLVPLLQSFADRLRNDARSAQMFEADWDTLQEAVALCRAVARSAALSAPSPEAPAVDAPTEGATNLLERLKRFKTTRHGNSIWLGDGVHEPVNVDELIAALDAQLVNEVLERQQAGFERCFEALGIADDKELERGWSSLVLEINRALSKPAVDALTECKGTGMRDSGGFHPWGESISEPCNCLQPGSVPGTLVDFDVHPQHTALDTPEPSLREIIRYYYLQAFSRDESERLADEYIALLADRGSEQS
jgi:hypothetical protein